MIFVTVGNQMPFDRLIRAVDYWSEKSGKKEVFAQIGKTKYRPEFIQTVSFLAPEQYKERISEATAIVSHAGIGSIIAALELGKPILVMPRRSALRETRNDHQISTAHHFQESGLPIHVAQTENELLKKLDRVELLPPPCQTLGATASPQLIKKLKEFSFRD